MINRITQTLGPEGYNLTLTIVVALLRGLLNHEGLWTILLDSTMCGVFSLAMLHTDYFSHMYKHSHDTAMLACMVIGGVGSKFLLKMLQSVFDSFLTRGGK
ncbi:phage holin family protein [Lelliottia wanjuensis]|uniref:phage holin family protein n=1 Tax=Lelliottia wanjuensis TaxID=3050585 RepID=UPI003307A7B5